MAEILDFSVRVGGALEHPLRLRPRPRSGLPKTSAGDDAGNMLYVGPLTAVTGDSVTGDSLSGLAQFIRPSRDHALNRRRAYVKMRQPSPELTAQPLEPSLNPNAPIR